MGAKSSKPEKQSIKFTPQKNNYLQQDSDISEKFEYLESYGRLVLPLVQILSCTSEHKRSPG